MHPETVIFTHIPKTAGTTLHRIIDQQYPESRRYFIQRHQEGVKAFANLSPERRAQLRMVRGHIPFGVHRYLCGSWTYITLLREPVDRVASFYYFVRRNPDHYLHECALAQGMTLRRYVESRVTLATDNFQTRLISGVWDTLPYGTCDADTLALARRNLDRHFAVVGLMERFDATLLMLKRRFGWGPVYYRRRNVSKNRPDREMLDPATVAVLRAHNALDLKLYAYAKARFAEQLAAQGLSLRCVLWLFKCTNYLRPILLDRYKALRMFSLRAWLWKIATASTPLHPDA